jgi:hypothetical protein
MIGPMVARMICPRCGRSVRTRVAGGLLAHKCSHGLWCVRPRGRGGRRATCLRCFAARQATLPGIVV